MTWKWEFVSGGEIEDTYIRQASLHDLVPDCEAIYLWRRELSAPGSALRDGTAFTRWLDSTMQVPTGEVCGQPLSHFVMLDQLTIQGRGLTPEKRRQLASFTNRPTARRWLARYIRSLSQFSPPLYCGETSDLVQRTRDHVVAKRVSASGCSKTRRRHGANLNSHITCSATVEMTTTCARSREGRCSRSSRPRSRWRATSRGAVESSMAGETMGDETQ